MSVFDDFQRKHEYLICVDSDGCVMDTMNCKHFHSFGPCLVDEWALENWQEDILRRWNEINLFQMTRGINRFKALAIALAEISEKYTPIVGVEGFARWVVQAPALNNETLYAAILTETDEDTLLCMRKALAWSMAVNDSVNFLPDELKKPFPFSRECLAAAHAQADVVLISGANQEAVEAEWESFGLLRHTDLVLAQDVGTELHCLEKMLEFGYDRDKVLMIGDAPGDLEAAMRCGVRFYPILVNWEEESWEDLLEGMLDLFLSGGYGAIQEEKTQVFVENLGG